MNGNTGDATGLHAGALLEMLDTSQQQGTTCALLTPAIKARLRELLPGQVLEVRVDDPLAREDIAAWCRLAGHELLAAAEEGPMLRAGAPWRDLPERYGAWQTCADRLYHWRRDGTWDRLLAYVQTKSDAVGEVIWEISVDSSTARAHQHASGARRRPSRAGEKRGFHTPKTKG